MGSAVHWVLGFLVVSPFRITSLQMLSANVCCTWTRESHCTELAEQTPDSERDLQPFSGKGKIRQPKIIMNFSPEPLLESWNSLTGNAGIAPGSKLCDLTQTSATVCLNSDGWLSKASLQARFCKACR